MQEISIQEYWSKDEVFGIDSIAFADGSVVPIEIDYESEENPKAIKTYGDVYTLEFGEKQKMSEFIKQFDFDEEDEDQDEIAELIRTGQILESMSAKEDGLGTRFGIRGEFELSDNSKLIFGDGSMGNEGFIVKVDDKGNLAWSLFSTGSNPFINCELIDNKIHIFSEYNFSLCIDPNDVLKTTIDNHLED